MQFDSSFGILMSSFQAFQISDWPKGGRERAKGGRSIAYLQVTDCFQMMPSAPSGWKSGNVAVSLFKKGNTVFTQNWGNTDVLQGNISWSPCLEIILIHVARRQHENPGRTNHWILLHWPQVGLILSYKKRESAPLIYINPWWICFSISSQSHVTTEAMDIWIFLESYESKLPQAFERGHRKME